MADIEKKEDVIWEIKKTGNMNVPVSIIANEKLKDAMSRDRTFNQIKNVSTLPGIVKHALVMPDGHEGYGFPIGGVAAFDSNEGLISPGGVGYDINCGVRLITTSLTHDQVKSKIPDIIKLLFKNVPSGVGSKGRLRLQRNELEKAVVEGVPWAVEKGYGIEEDIERCEEYGKMEGADPSKLSDKAMKRGLPQFGTLGAGNHFLEIQKVENVFNENTAKKFGLFNNQIVVMIHCGSRGFGHQVCDDYIRVMLDYCSKNNIELADNELCYARMDSKESDNYIGAMKCAVNYAFTNRHIIMHWVRESFDEVFGKQTSDEMKLVYDVAHNIAKFEEHDVDGQRRKLVVHRKGATRAFAAGRAELPSLYRDIGQPVILPGSMGTASYVMVGEQKGMEIAFGSTAHGAGRVMSRHQAINNNPWQKVQQSLNEKGIFLIAADKRVISEEAPEAYKDIDLVVDSVNRAGITSSVTKLIPLGVVKG
ncbi:RtcB family protein [Candidatus Micrarchaeota archaeon]|nr:RtcB family protein [Candidatus Micrarchaeota archaeon]